MILKASKRTVWLGLVAVAALLAAASAEAIVVTGSGALFGPAFQPEVGDEVLVMVSNAGRRPVRVEILVLRAGDYSQVSASGPIDVPPRSTASASHVYLDSFESIVAVRYRAAGRTAVRVSLQVKDPSGETQIFTDGFESGDLSA